MLVAQQNINKQFQVPSNRITISNNFSVRICSIWYITLVHRISHASRCGSLLSFCTNLTLTMYANMPEIICIASHSRQGLHSAALFTRFLTSSQRTTADQQQQCPIRHIDEIDTFIQLSFPPSSYPRLLRLPADKLSRTIPPAAHRYVVELCANRTQTQVGLASSVQSSAGVRGERCGGIGVR